MIDKEVSNSDNKSVIGQYISYIGPFIIFLGMARLMTFYSAFGISIISYLDFSEIITSFFDILFIVVIYFAYISIQNFVAGNKSEVETANTKRQKILNEDNLWKLIKLYIIYFKSLLIFWVVVIIGYLISYFVFNWVTFSSVLIIVAIFVFLLLFFTVHIEIERKLIHFQSSVTKKRFVYLTLYSLALTLSVIYYSSYQAGLIKRDKTTFGVSILLEDNQKIISDSTNYYIGKTQNYLFIYHEKLKTTDIYPMNRVKQLTMPQLK